MLICGNLKYFLLFVNTYDDDKAAGLSSVVSYMHPAGGIHWSVAHFPPVHNPYFSRTHVVVIEEMHIEPSGTI